MVAPVFDRCGRAVQAQLLETTFRAAGVAFNLFFSQL